MAAVEVDAGDDYQHRKPPLQVGGRLSSFIHRWRPVTSDPWVLQTVASGYRLEFTSFPQHCRSQTTTLPRNANKRLALTEEIKQLLRKNAIEKVHPQQVCFLSSFFLTTKKSGEWRPILNLRPLNKHIKPRRFKMESLAAVLPELKKGWWGATLDLKDAYLHIAIDPSDKKWLGFSIDGQTYRFKSLPFGLSTAPRTFTRVVKVVAEYLRRKGIYVFIYLDDWLLTAPSARVLRQNILITKRLVQSLGFIINEEKSAPEPTQRTQFLGALLDFKRGMVFPTQERVQAVTECARLILREQAPAARLWMRLLGLIASLTAILPRCRLHMRIIQLHVLSRFRSHKHPLSRRIPATNRVKKAVSWWTQPSNIQPGKRFSPLPTSSTLTTDASKTGWGAHWKNIHLSGTWSPSLAKHHINLLELWAIHIALRRLRKHLSGQSVLVKCDNMSVVMYLNKMGGVRSRSLCLQTVRLLLWCSRHGIAIQAAHLPGADNTLADSLSRRGTTIKGPAKIRGSSVDWHLNKTVCLTLFNKVGRPLIDLFADSSNSQLPTYCSWQKDPKAYARDAMSISWNRVLGFAFPPIALIPRVLEKLSKAKNCRLILIAPRWPRQTWFTRLLTMVAGEAIALPLRKDLIQTPEGSLLPRQTLKTLNLTAWQLSSDPTHRRDFQRKLQLSLESQGDLQPDVLTIPVSESITDGVSGTRLLHIQPLLEKSVNS